MKWNEWMDGILLCNVERKPSFGISTESSTPLIIGNRMRWGLESQTICYLNAHRFTNTDDGVNARLLDHTREAFKHTITTKGLPQYTWTWDIPRYRMIKVTPNKHSYGTQKKIKVKSQIMKMTYTWLTNISFQE